MQCNSGNSGNAFVVYCKPFLRDGRQCRKDNAAIFIKIVKVKVSFGKNCAEMKFVIVILGRSEETSRRGRGKEEGSGTEEIDRR